MQRLTGFIGLLLVLTFTSSGCIHYVEEPTPPGEVATSQAVAPVSLPVPPVNYAVPATNNPTSSTVRDDFDDQAFRVSYRQAGRPRIAIFLNRALSDDVREWKAYSRQMVSFSQAGTSTTGEKSTVSKSSGGVTIGRQYYQEEPARVDPGEDWMWRFEDGFLEPFLTNGVNVVDRATIVRLAAAASAAQGSANEPVSVKQIEIQALQNKADLFIEILIREDDDADLGYEFKATAKEVQTGIVRANVISRKWEGQEDSVKMARATSEGYTFSDAEGDGDMPGIDAIAENLAELTMTSMAKRWKN